MSTDSLTDVNALKADCRELKRKFRSIEDENAIVTRRLEDANGVILRLRNERRFLLDKVAKFEETKLMSIVNTVDPSTISQPPPREETVQDRRTIIKRIDNSANQKGTNIRISIGRTSMQNTDTKESSFNPMIVQQQQKGMGNVRDLLDLQEQERKLTEQMREMEHEHDEALKQNQLN